MRVDEEEEVKGEVRLDQQQEVLAVSLNQEKQREPAVIEEEEEK